MQGASPELKNIILRAGAGAGKTTTLTHLFLDYASGFQAQAGHFPRVVVTTFTRKATQELKERLLLLALERKRQDLFYYVTNKSLVQISTIHGVLSLLLGRQGHRLGLSADFTLLSAAQEMLMRRKILRKLILENAECEALLETYSFAQLEAALDVYYQSSFSFPELRFISQQEFAKKWADKIEKMNRRRQDVARAILAESSDASWKKYAEGLGHLPLGSGMDPVSLLSTIEGFFETYPRKPSLRSQNPAVCTETAEGLASLIQDLKDLVAAPECLPTYWQQHEKENQRFDILAKAYTQELLRQKLETGRISMADLELLSLKLIHDHPSSAESFSREWDFWMIDEYQDTSPVQVALLKALVGDRKSFIVGDPQQSIYLFRGARSEVFQEKMTEIQRDGGELQEKLTNYRSVPALLNFINFYFSTRKNHFAAMIPSPQKVLQTENPVAQVRVVEKAENLTGLSEETLAALERLQGLLQKGVSAENICVLARTRDSLEALAKAAEAYGIPVQIHVAGGYYRRFEIRDALMLLKFLVNPHDNVNFLACLRSPWVHLEDADILPLCHRGGGGSYWSRALPQIESLPERHPLKLLRKFLLKSQTEGYSRSLRAMLVELGLFDFTQKLDPTGRREANLWKLVSQLFESEKEPGFNFLDFFSGQQQALDLDSSGEDSDASPVVAPQRVNLMTIHASKGLQFDHVVVLGMNKRPRLSHARMFSIDESSGLWSLSLVDEEERKLQPSMLAQEVKELFNERELQEHFRVLYVALTRAKETLTLILQGKTEKNSWAENSPLNLLEGSHRQENFAYEVLQGSFDPQVQSARINEELKDPGPWQNEEPLVRPSVVAVTRMIAAEMTAASAVKPTSGAQLQKALAKAYRGTEAHRLFEALKYSEFEEIIAATGDEAMNKALRYLQKLQAPPLKDILDKGFAEWGFSFRYEHLWIRGQIDLWGRAEGAVWLLDYKTGSSQNSAQAFQQLKAYAWALHKMGFVQDHDKVHLAVIYPFEEITKTEENIHLAELQNSADQALQIEGL